MPVSGDARIKNETSSDSVVEDDMIILKISNYRCAANRLTRLKISDGSENARGLEGRVTSYHKCRPPAWLGLINFVKTRCPPAAGHSGCHHSNRISPSLF